jgi:hypothetical protein
VEKGVMSTFTYRNDSFQKYAPEVVEWVESKPTNPIMLAKTGKSVTIKKDDVWNEFKGLIKNKKWGGASKFLSNNGAHWSKQKTFETSGKPIRWTQIEKSIFSGAKIKITTAQQEQMTLKIIEEVLSSGSKDWKTFPEMYVKLKLNSIIPDLDLDSEWGAHFELQVRDIRKTVSLKNNWYKVYSYDNFMDFITNFVTKAPRRWYSKKDSWNPADIWLIKNDTVLNVYKKRIEESQSIREVNDILRHAFHKNRIVGISLKKSNAKYKKGKLDGGLKYEKVNLELAGSGQKDKLPDVGIISVNMNCEFDKKENKFISRTSTFRVKDVANKSQSPEFELSFRSNQSYVTSITFEFKQVGGSAQLGKVPKDKLEKWIKKEFKDLKGVGNITIPNHNDLPKDFDRNDWKDKVEAINKAKLGKKNISDLKDFVDNLEESYKAGGLSGDNATMMQMVEFVYILALFEQKDKLTEFVTKCFYFAQKKGQKYRFGPFGKLY